LDAAAYRRALDLLFSARQINAAEALRMELVNQVFAQENFLHKVNEYAVDLA
jgi:enoyl-CoA hydratase/carnithine racemase